jgi:hypothetical membrane protein
MSRPNLVRARWAFGLAVALTIAAMIQYPGGTPLVRSSEHYSLQHNFLSDLGMTVAYNGRGNLLGAVCFVTGLLFLLGGVVVVLAELLAICSTPARARRLARVAAVFALCACLAFVGVAFTPENRVMAAHVNFTFLGFRIAPVAMALLALAARAGHSVPRSITQLLALLASVFAAYAAILEWGPDPVSTNGLHFQVLAQKAVAGIAVGSFLWLSLALDRAEDRSYAQFTYGSNRDIRG